MYILGAQHIVTTQKSRQTKIVSISRDRGNSTLRSVTVLTVPTFFVCYSNLSHSIHPPYCQSTLRIPQQLCDDDLRRCYQRRRRGKQRRRSTRRRSGSRRGKRERRRRVDERRRFARRHFRYRLHLFLRQSFGTQHAAPRQHAASHARQNRRRCRRRRLKKKRRRGCPEFKVDAENDETTKGQSCSSARRRIALGTDKV